MTIFHLVRLFSILIAGWFQTSPAITAPIEGQTIQGHVAVAGTFDPAVFSSAELSFGYASDPTETWFSLQLLNQPPADATLATWDTTTLTDGDYRLRLRVFAPDGSYQDFLVNDLHVRNALPTPTPTLPAAATPAASSDLLTALPEEEAVFTPQPTALPAAVLLERPTPLPLPPNPAALTSETIFSIFTRGSLLVLILFVVLGLFLRLRRS